MKCFICHFCLHVCLSPASLFSPSRHKHTQLPHKHTTSLVLPFGQTNTPWCGCLKQILSHGEKKCWKMLHLMYYDCTIKVNVWKAITRAEPCTHTSSVSFSYTNTPWCDCQYTKIFLSHDVVTFCLNKLFQLHLKSLQLVLCAFSSRLKSQII